MAREGGERDHRLRTCDSREAADLRGDDVRELLVAQRPGQRAGVEITMLTTPTANKDVTSPLEVATTGVLLRPYKTFTLH